MARGTFGHIERYKRDKNGNWRYRIFWHEQKILKSKVVPDRKTGIELLGQLQLRYGQVDYSINYKDYYKKVVQPTYKHLAERTRKDYEYTWKLLSPYIQDIRIANTNWRLVQNIIDEFDTGKTQQKVFVLWRKILNLAIRDEIIYRNPCDKNIIRKPIKKKIKKIYRADEIRSILIQIDNTQFAIPFLLECVCGLRHEEFCALNNKDFKVEKENGQVIVTINKALTDVYGKKVLKEPKTSTSERLVVIPKSFSEYTTNNLSFIKDKKTLKEYRSPLAWTKAWKRYCLNNNIEYVPYGTMRSVYATLCAEAGCLDSLVALTMGHSGKTTKERNYQQATLEALRFNAEILERYIKFTYPLDAHNQEQL